MVLLHVNFEQMRHNYQTLTTASFFFSQKRDFREEPSSVLSALQSSLGDHIQPGGSMDPSLQVTYVCILSPMSAYPPV